VVLKVETAVAFRGAGVTFHTINNVENNSAIVFLNVLINANASVDVVEGRLLVGAGTCFAYAVLGKVIAEHLSTIVALSIAIALEVGIVSRIALVFSTINFIPAETTVLCGLVEAIFSLVIFAEACVVIIVRNDASLFADIDTQIVYEAPAANIIVDA